MTLEQDIVILGGGIAGLWLLHRLRNAGYSAVLLEKTALGDGQTIVSQGMIHGGLKYALGGALTEASEAIADMPAHWNSCLQGKGDVDLRGTRLLSDAYYLWPHNGLKARITAFLGSKMVSSKASVVSEHDMPAFFSGHLRGPLYRLHDIVLDVPSLLHTLGERCRPWIYRSDSQAVTDAHGNIQSLLLADGRRLQAKLFICTAGNGNADWLERIKPTAIEMQRRPLQMMVVKHRNAHPLYVHCVADQFTATPDLTITTHPCSDGMTAWYLGGELAESGAHVDGPAQIERTRAKLATLFPWCDFSDARYHGFYIDRAEARQKDGKRPDRDSVLGHGNVLYCWPTKLTLAPVLANSVMQQIAALGVAAATNIAPPIAGLDYPGVAQPVWERL
ncbi:MAG TPA: FAD-dependent oxidoreductase [Candidatus Acidoferrum sp.]|nr:FAD-dependent oxidoreductase [Candidatus Acidoferrum sp.]